MESTPTIMSPEEYRQFPRAFQWGVSTASYQIEGAVREGGRLPSIWDGFSHTTGKTFNGDTGDVACDHYHRMPQDVALMAQLGIAHYRFSIAWPRVMPSGYGSVNSEGLDFYDRLVDTLLDHNIHPLATLYHWDLPARLGELGGWANRDTVYWFQDYVNAVYLRLGDRVHDWITHNEPMVATVAGHLNGDHAPGLRDANVTRSVAHHLLLSHGLAVNQLKDHSDPKLRVGITFNLNTIYPGSDHKDVANAMRRADAFINRWFLDPIFRGSYPEELDQMIAPMPHAVIKPGDMATIGQTIDFLGVNYYNPVWVVPHAEAKTGFETVKPDIPVTGMNWPIFPQGLTDILVRIHREYRPQSIVITENGAVFDDVITDGQIHDKQRAQYLVDHWRALSRALSMGVPLRGYYLWSFLDNFEWAFGYSKRFGMVHVDYQTLERTPKDSAYLYARLIREFMDTTS